MKIPRFAKYLSPTIVSDEFTMGAEVSNDVIILKQKYIIYSDILFGKRNRPLCSDNQLLYTSGHFYTRNTSFYIPPIKSQNFNTSIKHYISLSVSEKQKRNLKKVLTKSKVSAII